MLIVVKNAEHALIEQLEELDKKNPTYRCLYLRCSLLQDDQEKWLPGFLHQTEEILIGEPCQSYLCHDGDVFIIARSLTQKMSIKLVELLAQKSQIAPPPQGIMALFEIGIDKNYLQSLCQKKIIQKEEKERNSEAQVKQKTAALEREKILKEVDQALLSTLGQRRAERDKAEIMVVEDDPFTQRLINNAIGSKYTVTITGDGQGALLNYIAKAPDIIFLDIGLPDIDGLKILDRLFKIDPEAHVIMFSGNGSKENIMRAVNLGARGFVGKPFTKEKLFQYIEKSPFILARQTKETSHGNSFV
jgi:CheY-like chemotaxis protein